jgi:hypothetical protein
MRGWILRRLGRAAEGRADMYRAADFLKGALKERHSARITAQLLFEVANAYSPWDLDEALRYIRQIRSLNIDIRDPRNSPIVTKASMMYRELMAKKKAREAPPAPSPAERPPSTAEPRTAPSPQPDRPGPPPERGGPQEPPREE